MGECAVTSPSPLWLRRLYNRFVWLSQTLNVWIYGGDPDETLSSRIGKKRRAGERLDPFLWVIWRVGTWVKRDHFTYAIEDDEGGNSDKNRRRMG